jgi:hypothetical protein
MFPAFNTWGEEAVLTMPKLLAKDIISIANGYFFLRAFVLFRFFAFDLRVLRDALPPDAVLIASMHALFISSYAATSFISAMDWMAIGP